MKERQRVLVFSNKGVKAIVCCPKERIFPSRRNAMKDLTKLSQQAINLPIQDTSSIEDFKEINILMGRSLALDQSRVSSKGKITQIIDRIKLSSSQAIFDKQMIRAIKLTAESECVIKGLILMPVMQVTASQQIKIFLMDQNFKMVEEQIFELSEPKEQLCLYLEGNWIIPQDRSMILGVVNISGTSVVFKSGQVCASQLLRFSQSELDNCGHQIIKSIMIESRLNASLEL